MPNEAPDSRWIWIEGSGDSPNQYAYFRRAFERGGPGTGSLSISVDTDFVACLNGEELGRGQFSDYPERKTFSRFDLRGKLLAGRNALCILAYYCGEDFSTYRKGPAGLLAALESDEIEIVSDGSWRCRLSPSYRSGAAPKVTPQLGFVAEYDAREELDWIGTGYDDSDWPFAAARAGDGGRAWSRLEERPVPPLARGERPAARVVAAGELTRSSRSGTFAEQVDADILGPGRALAEPLDGMRGIELRLDPPTAPANGLYAIVDMVAEDVGLLAIDIVAAESTVVDIAHGEHLAGGRVRARIGQRNFADRYICKEGENRFEFPFRRLGCRYIQLDFTETAAAVVVKYAGIVPILRELPRAASFECGDGPAGRLRAMSERTLRLCMHDHYEDCPWREQALYSYDSRNQMLFGYYAWGNYRFAEASIDLLGRGLREDGLLELCAPARVPVTIPAFSFVWATQIREYYIHSGDDGLFRRYAPQIREMILATLALRDERSGLFRLRRGESIWNFYEWVPGLDFQEPAGEELHALYNLYFLEMLEAYSLMLRLLGEGAEAARLSLVADGLRAAIDRVFWNEGRGCYATVSNDGELSGYHEHTQLLALYLGVAPTSRAERAAREVMSGSLIGISLSPMVYMLYSMMSISPETRAFASAAIERRFEAMARVGGTTMWETDRGAADFEGAGSLCHGWSAVPLYYYHAWVLGVRPLGPGFGRFLLAPYPDRFAFARGAVVTPSGEIRVEWERRGGALTVSASGPEGLVPVLSPYIEAPIERATYNGQPLRDSRRSRS